MTPSQEDDALPDDLANEDVGTFYARVEWNSDLNGESPRLRDWLPVFRHALRVKLDRLADVVVDFFEGLPGRSANPAVRGRSWIGCLARAEDMPATRDQVDSLTRGKA